jgi:6-phospho-beta-glucosidase
MGGSTHARYGLWPVKLTIVGGGGFRVPLVYGALLAKRERLPFDEVVLHDLEEGRMERMATVLHGLAQERGEELPFRATTDLDDAVEGADFVFSAIRVGRLEGRVVDESVPLSIGVLGQETTGPGGICFALRTIPAMVHLAETIAEKAPQAWLINFTNPAGMVTEAAQQVLGDRVVGICDSPSGLCRRVARALGLRPEQMWFDYFGLNHLGWLKGAHDAERDRLPELLADDTKLAGFEEGRLFGGDWLRALGMIPNEYLYYFYEDAVAHMGDSPRGAYLLESQAAFYAQNGQDPAQALQAWRATRAERDRTYMAAERLAAGVEADHDDGGDGGGYEGEAMAVVEAIANNTRAIMILNTANRSALPFLDERAVVEVPSIVGRTGPVPVAVGPVPAHAQALVTTIKDVERTTIEAARHDSPELAVRALALHPLVPSVTAARKIFDGYRSRLPELAERFA